MATKKGLGSFIKGLFGIADDVPTPKVDSDKIKKIDDFTSGYDKTTKPGEFKKGPEVIDEDGNPVAKEYSYNPESFTDMQRREGKGEFSDDALRQTYMDSVDADVMSLDEYIIKARGITQDQLEAERALKAKPVNETTTPETTGSRPSVDNFVSRVKEVTNRSEEDIRQAIVDIANEAYEPGSPKLMSVDDDASIDAFLDNRLMYNQGDMEEFVDEFFQALKNVEPTSYTPPMIRDSKTMKSAPGEKIFNNPDYQQSYDIVDEYGFRVTDDPADIIPLNEMSDKDIKLTQLGVPMNSKKYKEMLKRQEDGELMSEIETDPIRKKNAKAVEDAMGITDRKKIQEADDNLRQLATDDIMEAIEEGDFKKAQEIEDAFNDGTYVPGGKKRTLNAEGGRIGLKDGGGPKIGRRGFLGLLGAGAASLMLPFRAADKVAPVVTKAIKPVAGMPDWFPLLVNRIRTKGKVKREPGYEEFTSGGDTEKVYQLDDYTLYEDMSNGRITVTGRGNDYQQVSMEYTPGENKVMTDKFGKRGVVTDEPTFEAGEYAKGDPYDYENFGDYDDMKGDLSNWENFATGGKKVDQKKSVIDDFIKSQTDPNIIDDMAKGGRVGMAQGGIASKFKERVNYGN